MKTDKVFSASFTPDPFDYSTDNTTQAESPVFDVSSVSKETLDTDVIWETMPTYDGEVKHYEEI